MRNTKDRREASNDSDKLQFWELRKNESKKRKKNYKSGKAIKKTKTRPKQLMCVRNNNTKKRNKKHFCKTIQT